MNRVFFASALLLLSQSIYSATDDFGSFEGTIDLKPVGCEQVRKCKLTYDLRYKDPLNIVWKADANDVTDGATIPSWAQPIIGDPYDPHFVKPAAIHDHYCEEIHRVRGWRETHKMFYYGLRNQGVSELKAKVMYAAILVGGPKWRKVIEGKPCGANCVNMMKTTTTLIQRPKLDGDTRYEAVFHSIRKAIEASPAAYSIDQITTMATERLKDDEFFANPDVIDKTNTNM